MQQKFSKIVNEDFQEKKKGKSKKPRADKTSFDDDTPEIFAKYCPPARIKKQIYKIRDDGNDIEMKMIPILMNKVLWDMFDEEWQEIVFNYRNINLVRLRSLIGGECARLIKEVLFEGAE